LTDSVTISSHIYGYDNSAIVVTGSSQCTISGWVELFQNANIQIQSSASFSVLQPLVANGQNGQVLGSGLLTASGLVIRVNCTFTVNSQLVLPYQSTTSISLGAVLVINGTGSGQGVITFAGVPYGELRVSNAGFNLSAQIFAGNAGGTITFESDPSASTIQSHVLQAGSWHVNLKTTGNAVLSLAGPVDVFGDVWVNEASHLLANQDLDVRGYLQASESATVEVAGGNVQSARFGLEDNTTYIVRAAYTDCPHVNATVAAVLAGAIELFPDFALDASTRVIIVTYPANARNGTFADLKVWKGNTFSEMSPLLFIERSLFTNPDTNPDDPFIRYGTTDAYVQGGQSIGSQNTISTSFITLLVSWTVFFAR